MWLPLLVQIVIMVSVVFTSVLVLFNLLTPKWWVPHAKNKIFKIHFWVYKGPLNSQLYFLSNGTSERAKIVVAREDLYGKLSKNDFSCQILKLLTGTCTSHLSKRTLLLSCELSYSAYNKVGRKEAIKPHWL